MKSDRMQRLINELVPLVGITVLVQFLMVVIGEGALVPLVVFLGGSVISIFTDEISFWGDTGDEGYGIGLLLLVQFIATSLILLVTM